MQKRSLFEPGAVVADAAAPILAATQLTESEAFVAACERVDAGIAKQEAHVAKLGADHQALQAKVHAAGERNDLNEVNILSVEMAGIAQAHRVAGQTLREMVESRQIRIEADPALIAARHAIRQATPDPHTELSRMLARFLKTITPEQTEAARALCLQQHSLLMAQHPVARAIADLPY